MNKKKNLTTKETFTLAVQNHQKNNLQVAENLYKETLKTNPNHVDAHNNLGLIFKELGELPGVFESVRIRISLHHPRRKYIIDKLKKNNIYCNILYPFPIHLMRGYSYL